MKKYFLWIAVLLFLALLTIGIIRQPEIPVENLQPGRTATVPIESTLEILGRRNDDEALVKFEQILAIDPGNTDALWAKAEALRRKHKFHESRLLLDRVLTQDPLNCSALNSLAYIKYKQGQVDEALELVNKVLSISECDRRNLALAYMMLGTINSNIASNSGIFRKIAYAAKIKGSLLKAKDLAPELPEVRLALGTFYLLAPRIIGGNINKAAQELQAAVDIAPRFATANARLAQVYKIKKNITKYNFYLSRAEEIDPENEVVAELEGR